MNRVNFFHDSCIKELKYVRGAYIEEDLSTYPLNDKRILNIIIQCQFEDVSMIEMQFIGLKCLRLVPVDEEYTCEIMDSTMLIKDNCIYWCDCGELSENVFEDYKGTLICASKLRRRTIENGMGKGDFYIAVK